MKTKPTIEYELAADTRAATARRPRQEVELRELPAFVERLIGKRAARRLPADGRITYRWD